MDINLEIEFKCLINHNQYQQLKNDLFIGVEGFSQTNEYFVDKKHLLRHLRWSLRVRHIHDTLEFTLKKPDGFSKIEINEILTPQQYQLLKNHQAFESGILNELNSVGITVQDLDILTSLTTIRYEKSYQDGLLCLDLNTYQDITDYEIEYEATSERKGREIFMQLLAPYHIFYTNNCLGKMTRAINALSI